MASAEPKYHVSVRGGDEASFMASPDKNPIEDKDAYDVVIVGGGLAGLTSALYLSDQGKHVLILEKEEGLGGLAYGGSLSYKIRFDRGAAYWTEAYEEELEILKRIGLGDYKQKFAIYEPADSYLWKGRLYPGIWEQETLKELPSSFELFKYELQAANKAGFIPNQPFEETKPDPKIVKQFGAYDPLALDDLSAAEWIRSMPEKIKHRHDKDANRIYKRFLADTNLNRDDPMGDVIGLLDLYCRSALGTTSDKVSAVAFANFYISEIDTRYTTTVGTGGAAELIENLLKRRPRFVNVKTSATVTGLDNAKDGVAVTYVMGGKTYRTNGRYAVFAAQLKLAPTLIHGLAEQEPARAELLKDLGYSHYSVHTIFVKGHPYRATYDTWTRAEDYTDDDFTDVILGRWMDPSIKGYKNYRTFRREPKDEFGIMTIYHPLPQKWIGQGYTKDQATDLAEHAVDRMLELYNPMLASKYHTKIDVETVETNRWPFSVHIAAPGHFKKKVKILRKPFGRIYFANNNLGTPAFEEALFRGHCAAVNLLLKFAKESGKSKYQPEPWTKCPIE